MEKRGALLLANTQAQNAEEVRHVWQHLIGSTFPSRSETAHTLIVVPFTPDAIRAFTSLSAAPYAEENCDVPR